MTQKLSMYLHKVNSVLKNNLIVNKLCIFSYSIIIFKQEGNHFVNNQVILSLIREFDTFVERAKLVLQCFNNGFRACLIPSCVPAVQYTFIPFDTAI
jgi:hypothetical protein